MYPLRLRLLFPNDVEILKPKVGIGSNQIEIDLRKVFLENITLSMNKVSYFWKINSTKTLGRAYAYTCMCTHAQALRTHASCMRTHVKIPKIMKSKFSTSKFGFWNESHTFRSSSKPPFLNYKKPYMVAFQKHTEIVNQRGSFSQTFLSQYWSFKITNHFLVWLWIDWLGERSKSS